MKIGFQGDLFSNSEEAAFKFSKIHKIKTPCFIPLISSRRVVTALLNKEIDYGVLALENKIAGPVQETLNALSNKIKMIDTLTLPIHHSLFIKNKDYKIDSITSHIQALKQTVKYRKEKS